MNSPLIPRVVKSACTFQVVFILALLVAADAQAQSIERVSLDWQGAEIDSYSQEPSIDFREEWVTFSSPAGLVPGDVSGVQEVYARNLATGHVVRVTEPFAGGEPTFPSEQAIISGDGSTVGFTSYATNLLATGLTQGPGRVFAYDMQSGQLEVVSRRPSGDLPSFGVYLVSVSADGQTFLARTEGQLMLEDVDSEWDLYVLDRDLGAIELVDLGANVSLTTGFMSHNARWVVFNSQSQLDPGDMNNDEDVYVLDRKSGAIALGSATTNGIAGNQGARSPAHSISEDGRILVFASGSTDLVAGVDNGQSQIYRKNLESGNLTCVSVNSSGVEGSHFSWFPTVSIGGDVIVFQSDSVNLDARDTNTGPDIYAWTENNPYCRLLSVSPQSGVAGNDSSRLWFVASSASGASAVFWSNATDLTLGGDANGYADAFIVRGIETDSDKDLLIDAREFSLGTDPMDQDSDDDGLSDGEEVHQARRDPSWRQRGADSWYQIRPNSTWNDASFEARSAGFELVSIQDQAENDWILSTFGELVDPAALGLWTGLNNFGGFLNWTSGEPVTYLNWATGEPSANVFAAYMNGAGTAEPGAWHSDFAGVGLGSPIWEATGVRPPLVPLNPLLSDTDSDGVQDGTELGLTVVSWTGDLDGDGIPDVLGTDTGVFIPDADPASTTDPLDADSDDDGLADGQEDSSGDGKRDALETDPTLWDTDEDLLSDGLELGVEVGLPDTDGMRFVPDSDPLTTTDPLNPDSDFGGVPDGVEDQGRDGGIDSWETDPSLGADEAFAVYFRNLRPGQRVEVDIWNATPGEAIIPAYSIAGGGPSSTGIGLVLDLTRPIVLMDPLLAGLDGRATVSRLRVPVTAPVGFQVWLQAVEIPISSQSQPRASNPVLLPVGSN